MFLKSEINKALLLEDYYFDNQDNNIDYLNNSLGFFEKPEEQRKIIENASFHVEKFHCYFHFEQSYFHLKYAELLESEGNLEEAIKHYKDGIFQDHLNQIAHSKLVRLLDGEEKDKALEYATKLNVDFRNEKPYTRPYESFKSYVQFATDSNKDFLDKLKIKENYDEKLDFQNIITDISARHKLYHKHAAIIYINYSTILYKLGEEALAKNAVIKASNLDVELKLNINSK